MTLDDAAPAAAASLAALVNRAYRGAEAARGWAHEAGLLTGQRTDATMLRDAMAGGTIILVAREDGCDVGCVAIEPMKGGCCHIGMLTVAPERQDGGLGRRLLAAAEARALRQGATAAALTVIHLRHGLIAWYERRGYRRTGQTEQFPDDQRFGAPLVEDLHFVVLGKRLTPQA